MQEDRVIKITFIISLTAHCLFLGAPGFNSNRRQPENSEKISVQIEIEKPPLLPKIDVMGEEKKLPPEADPPSVEKKIVKEEKFLEPKSQPEEEKIVRELEVQPKEQIEKEIVEQPQPEPPQEIVEVINPQKEAMLRYQDMVKQKIESCRRYPNWAKKQGIEGIVYLAFVVLPTGVIKDIKIVQSSGFGILDKEAVSTVKRANPFPPIPGEMKVSSLSMEVSILFTLQY